MPKLKTKKAAAKRYRLTGTGKVKRKDPSDSGKMGKRKRNQLRSRSAEKNQRMNIIIKADQFMQEEEVVLLLGKRKQKR